MDYRYSVSKTAAERNRNPTSLRFATFANAQKLFLTYFRFRPFDLYNTDTFIMCYDKNKGSRAEQN